MVTAHREGALQLKWSNLPTKGVLAWRPSLFTGILGHSAKDIEHDQEDFRETDGTNDDPEFSHIFLVPNVTAVEVSLSVACLSSRDGGTSFASHAKSRPGPRRGIAYAVGLGIHVPFMPT